MKLKVVILLNLFEVVTDDVIEVSNDVPIDVDVDDVDGDVNDDDRFIFLYDVSIPFVSFASVVVVDKSFQRFEDEINRSKKSFLQNLRHSLQKRSRTLTGVWISISPTPLHTLVSRVAIRPFGRPK